MLRRVAIVVLVAGCGKKAEAPPPVIEDSWHCDSLPFETSTQVPEVSGAAIMTIEGAKRIVVIGDSGNHGAYGLLDADTGATVEQGVLPLNGSTDDLEGLALRGDHLLGITSPGWVLEWKRVHAGFELVDGPYPLAAVDLPPQALHHGIGDVPPPGNGMVCDGTKSNCGRNFEGICLAPRPTHGVSPPLAAGFAAAKADGHLYPLTDVHEGHALAVSRDGAIEVAKPGHLADCTYDAAGTLYVGNNLFGLSTVSRIDNWRDPVHAKVVQLGSLGAGFPEALAVDGDVFYRFSDTGGSPSLMGKFRCTRSAR